MTDARDILIERCKNLQKNGMFQYCPRCGSKSMYSSLYHNALSRICELYICPRCGQAEALEDFSGERMPIDEWSLIKDGFRPVDSLRLSVKLDVVLTTEDIDDIMSAALDSGITYWCSKAEVVGDEYFGEYASEQISRGGKLRLYDMESDKRFDLTLDNFLKGFQLACENGYAHDWFDGTELDCCQIDGEAADVIIQYAIFEDVIYG